MSGLGPGPGCVVPRKGAPEVLIDPKALDMNALSEKQRHALGCIAIGQDGGHHRRTLDSLVKLGAIVQIPQIDGPFRIMRYGVPLPVHMAWCFWCDENCDEEGNEVSG